MIKRIAALLLVAFVFTGAWWDEKKPATKASSTPAPYSNQTSQETQPAAFQGQAEETSQPAASEPAVAAPANPNSTAAALKVLSEGNPDERKARMESLVRLSNALRKQRELKEQQQQ